ncbi:MAG: Gldg family protein [Phycisphaeraceae bacterium]|nr:Gldg family protein [Phycisphaeraceae bacterium]
MKSTVPQTHAQRRARFGLNVAVSAAAAVVLVILLNVLVYLTLPGRGIFRLDLTATRRYSLAEQTLGVLDRLDKPYRIVSLVARGGLPDEQQRISDQVLDLVDEYAARSSHIQVEHIATSDIARQESFLKELHDHYSAQLNPLAESIANSRKALDNLTTLAPAQAQAIEQLGKHAALQSQDIRQALTHISQLYNTRIMALQQHLQRVGRLLDGPLPNYPGAKAILEAAIEDLDGNFLAPVAGQFEQWARQDQAPPLLSPSTLPRPTAAVPAAVRESLLQIAEQFEAQRKDLQTVVTALRVAPAVQQYEELVTQLGSNDVLVVIGPGQVRVLSVLELFRPAEAGADGPQEVPEYSFLGEEMLTGALVAMALNPPPLVVFLYAGGPPPLGQDGQYLFNYVAEQLRKVGFRVEQWTPQPMTDRSGQNTIKPADPPKPQAGQKTVWVVLPADAGDMNFLAQASSQSVMDHVRQRMEAGDNALFIFGSTPMAQFQPSPVAGILAEFGITPQLDRLILSQRVTPAQGSVSTSELHVDHWPKDFPVAAALGGMPAVFVSASPLLLSPSTDALKVWPVAVVEGSSLWAQLNPDPSRLSEAKYDPAAAPPDGRFIVGAAAEAGGRRVIAVADPIWAIDQLTQYKTVMLVDQRLVSTIAFPGNAELFVNSVYWLAGQEELIAAGARAQDVRRIADISDAGMAGLRWAVLAGLPSACLGLGAVVWAVRRRDLSTPAA